MLQRLCALYSQAETVLPSTCNRVEFHFAAAEPYYCPAAAEVAKFVADFHGLDTENVSQELFEANDGAGGATPFHGGGQSDSMVVGEAQSSRKSNKLTSTPWPAMRPDH